MVQFVVKEFDSQLLEVNPDNENKRTFNSAPRLNELAEEQD
jgi:hypothetical protein